MKDHPKDNYAFEIRFLDDKVQVFDIAAKRKHQGDGIPTEYKQDEVLRGQLRYSKLLGSTPSKNKLGGFEDDGTPYEHQATTKRSKNRKSTQRHTFFMMGSGGGEQDTSYHYNHQDNYQQPRDSIIIEELKPACISINCNAANVTTTGNDSDKTSCPSSPTPSVLIKPHSPPLSPPQREMTPRYSIDPEQSYTEDHALPMTPINTPSPPPPSLLLVEKPVYTTLRYPGYAHSYSTTKETYTSSIIQMENHKDHESRVHIQRPASVKSDKRTVSSRPSQRSCCIIS